MAFRFPGFRPRSNGVPVTRAAHRAIRAGNAARGRGDWQAAATAYRVAVEAMPGLGHIWLQLGHAAKEAGDMPAATRAYGRAAVLMPRDPEPHAFLGHLARRTGDGGAAAHFLAALRLAPGDVAASGELLKELLGRRPGDAALFDEAVRLLDIDPEEARFTDTGPPGPGTVFFDVTDLIGFFAVSRTPTGVQRVQMEVILAMAAVTCGRPVALCVHSPARRGWSVLPLPAFRALCAASRDAALDAAGWTRALRLVLLGGALADDLRFPDAALLVGLGAGAPHPNYLLDIRTAAARRGLAYVPFAHDIIPQLFPQWFVPHHAAEFRRWLVSAMRSANGFLANSAATRADLLGHALRIGEPIDPGCVHVVRLDGRPAAPARPPLPDALLARRGLEPRGFVLCVSTVEPRKNHAGLFRAWLALAARVPGGRLPRLVCVGGRGWLNDEAHALVAAHRVLARSVLFLHDVDDEELALLYRTCAFTVYPSFYEGWGLPITEALCHGRLAAVSRTSAMPEAAGPLAVYFDPHDPAAIADTLLPLIVDPEAVPRAEARIAAGFRARDWTAIGAEIVAGAIAIARRAPAVAATAMRPATRYGLAPGGAAGMADGEPFRHGTGWSTPVAEGCVVEAPDALLRLAVPAGGGSLVVSVRGTAIAAGYAVRAGTATAVGGVLPGDARELTVALAPGEREVAIDVTAPILVEWLRLDAAPAPGALADRAVSH